MSKPKALLDIKLFRRLLSYVLVYRSIFIFVAISAVLISIFSTITPYLIKIAIDDYLAVSNFEGFVLVICLMLINLILTVVFMFLFSYLANWLGQNVIYDLRVKLFDHILNFKMSYFDKSSILQMYVMKQESILHDHH